LLIDIRCRYCRFALGGDIVRGADKEFIPGSSGILGWNAPVRCGRHGVLE
jgi:hypothetical protein